MHYCSAQFATQYAPLYERRADIIAGKIEPTAEEIAAGEAADSDDEDDEEAKVSEIKEDGEEEAPKGIADFWLTALQNHQGGIADLITEADEGVSLCSVPFASAVPRVGSSMYTDCGVSISFPTFNALVDPFRLFTISPTSSSATSNPTSPASSLPSFSRPTSSSRTLRSTRPTSTRPRLDTEVTLFTRGLRVLRSSGRPTRTSPRPLRSRSRGTRVSRLRYVSRV